MRIVVTSAAVVKSEPPTSTLNPPPRADAAGPGDDDCFKVRMHSVVGLGMEQETLEGQRCVAVTVRQSVCYAEKKSKRASKARATATPSTGADARPASAGVV